MKYLFFLLVFLPCITINAQQPVKRIYIANDDHTDYMWTADEAKYDSAFVKMLDYYIEQIELSKHRPDDLQTRWNCDGSFWLKTYQKYRSPQQFNRLIEKVRSGHISVPLNSLVSTYGAQPTEAVLRGMFYAGQLERKHNLRFPLAVCMENQTMPLGLSSLWAGSGAKYSWKGVCGCATRISKKLAGREHQVYNYKGLDNQNVLMKWYDRSPGSIAMGGYAEARKEEKIKNPVKDVASVVEELDKMCDVTPGSKYPYNIAGAFGYGWDDLETYNAPVFTKVADSLSNGFRKVRVSNEVDFFEDMQKTYKNFPSQSVTYGNEWDLYCASMNETTARVRRATEKLRTAESLATLVSLKDNAFFKNLNAMKEQAWEAFGLYWEHDWTADGPISRQDRANWQIKEQKYISGYVDSLHNQALAGLGKLIPASAKPRFYVYNSLNWSRSDYSDVEYSGKLPVKVIDVSTNKEAAMQVVKKSGKQYLRIWAENIPPVGYKVFEIINGQPQKLIQAATFSNGVLKNNYYKIKISNAGVITQLFDLKASKELIKKNNNRYFNDLGSADLNAGVLTIENAGPVSVTVKAVSTDPLPHVVRITLYHKSNRIDIEDSINANFDEEKYWSFSLNFNRPTTRYEELGSILTAKKASRGGSYANNNARYDWQTFNHFAAMGENDYNVILSNQDCSFFKLGNSTPDSLWETSSQFHALAGGQIDNHYNGRLGVPKQNGETNFQYSFSLTGSAKPFDASTAMKFSLEHQNPLLAAEVLGGNGAISYPSSQFSLLRVSTPNVFLWALKPSEEGIAEGLIARFWNFNQKPVSTIMNINNPVSALWKTSHIETNEQKLSPIRNKYTLKFEGNQINTYRIVTGGR